MPVPETAFKTIDRINGAITVIEGTDAKGFDPVEHCMKALG